MRVPVQTLFDYLEGGETLEDFLRGFPTVTRDLAFHALEEAKQLLLHASDAPPASLINLRNRLRHESWSRVPDVRYPQLAEPP